MRIVNNYSRMSFNFGPTLLAWMEKSAAAHLPESAGLRIASARSGLAVMDRPLRRCTTTSFFRWPRRATALRKSAGASPTSSIVLAASRKACGWRRPPSIWKAWICWRSTASASPSLLRTSARGCAPFRRRTIRKRRYGTQTPQGDVDPTQPYLVRTMEGRSIAVFFYDGPISRAIAFEGPAGQWRRHGQTPASRLSRKWPTRAAGPCRDGWRELWASSSPRRDGAGLRIPVD